MFTISDFFFTYLYSTFTQHGYLHYLLVTMSRVTYLFYGPTQEPVLATVNTGKTRDSFWKKIQVNGP